MVSVTERGVPSTRAAEDNSDIARSALTWLAPPSFGWLVPFVVVCLVARIFRSTLTFCSALAYAACD